MQRLILAAGERPFTDHDAAELKRDVLARELGNAAEIIVVDHPEGGWAVEIVQEQSGRSGRRSSNAEARERITVAASDPRRSVLLEGIAQLGRQQHEPSSADSVGDHYRTPPSPAQALMDHTPVRTHAAAVERSNDLRDKAPSTQPEGGYPEQLTLHPAPRAFVLQHLMAVLGALCVLHPHWVFQLMGVGFPEDPTLGAAGLAIVVVCGLLAMAISVGRFVTTYLFNSYHIDAQAVEQVHWYTKGITFRRRNPRVHFAHVRTVDVDQGMLQMLLNVGTVRLAADGTDTYEVELRHIAAPRRLQQEFQRRQLRATQARAIGDQIEL